MGGDKPGAHYLASTSALASRNLQFLLLTVAATAALYARTAVSPLQETIRATLALSDNQMALLQGPALALAPVTAAIPIGLLVDRYLRVRLLLIFAITNVVGTTLTALAPNFSALVLARCMVGLAHTATATAVFSLLADYCVPEERGRASMLVTIGQIAGIAAAFAWGGVLAARFDSDPEGWRSAMLWLTGPLLLVPVLLLAMREPSRRRSTVIYTPDR